MSKSSPEYLAAVKLAKELHDLAAAATKKAAAAGATDADKAAATEAQTKATEAASVVKAMEATGTLESTSEGKGKPITRIKNLSKALQYVGDVRILPDDVGSDFTDELHGAAMANPGYVALINKGLLKVE